MAAAEYLNVEFVGDASEFQCVRCDHVLFQHYMSNCGHAFCANCKRIVDDGSQRWRCPRCQQFIMNIDVQNEDFDRKLQEKEAHCPNQKYGCSFVHQLKFIRDHLKECEFTREKCLPKLIEENGNKNMNAEQMFEINKNFNMLNAEMREMREKIFYLENLDRAPELSLEKVMNEIKCEMKAEISEIKLELDKIKNVNSVVEECKSKLSEFKGQSDSVYRLIDYKEEKLLAVIHQTQKELNAKLNELRTQIEEEVNRRYREGSLNEKQNLSMQFEVLRVNFEQQLLKIDKLNEFREEEHKQFRCDINKIQSTIEDLKNRHLKDLARVPHAHFDEDNPERGRLENTWPTLHKINLNGQILEYAGRGLSHQDVGSAQARHPLSPSNDYFEIIIVDSGGDICPIITMGLTHWGFPKYRHPGWNLGSIGYHADDGMLYHEGGKGKPFGPKCCTGDRMGCGINFPEDYDGEVPSDNRQGSARSKKEFKVYFTINGRPVGYTIIKGTIPPGGFYPTVGMRTWKAKVRVNLHPQS